MKGVLRRDDYTLTIEQASVPYTSICHHEIDPAWSEVDPYGHRHTSTNSLAWITTETYWCGDCRAEHEKGEWRCPLCGSVVEPKYVWRDTSMVTRYAAGLRDITIQFDDGRGYRLRDDENPTMGADCRLTEDFLAKLKARAPDWEDGHDGECSPNRQADHGSPRYEWMLRRLLVLQRFGYGIELGDHLDNNTSQFEFLSDEWLREWYGHGFSDRDLQDELDAIDLLMSARRGA